MTQRLRAGHEHTGWTQGLRLIPAGWWGMVIAHLGVGVFVLGVTLARGLDHVQDVILKIGQSVTVGGYEFQFQSLQRAQGPNYVAAQARFDVQRDGKRVATLQPERRLYVVQRMPMTEAAIDRGLTRDLYVSLAETGPDGAWGVRVQVKPFMSWVWAGVLLIALGGAVSALDKRYRRVRSAAKLSHPHTRHGEPSTQEMPLHPVPQQTPAGARA